MQAHQKPHLIFSKKALQSVVAAALMVSCPASIIAQDYNQFTPVEEYPTAEMPFAIVDIAIGQTKDEAKALMEKQLGREVAFETGVLETSSPSGNRAVFEMTMGITTPWMNPMVRMGSEPYDEINVILGSGVIENRVIGIRRTFRMDPAEMPAPAAIRAQLVEQYGEPSIETGNAMLYAYNENGFIESLEDASQALEPSSGHTIWNGITLASDTPCIFLNPPGFKPTPNKKEPSAESCKGVFEVKIEGDRANFALYDFTLDAFNQAETDRQIDEALAVETPAADMKL